jgi:putative transcriptional regulator
MTDRLLTPALLIAVLAIAALAWTAPALPAEPSQSILLVAKRQFQDRLYGATILVVRPLGADRHIGFILNRPTRVTLGELFPFHAPSQKVAEPVYLGGPVSTEVLFALVQRSASPGGSSLQLLPDLFLAIDSEVIDRIIETEPDHARFFAGIVLWKPGELAEEVKRGLWFVLDAKSELVLRKSTEGLWEELVGRSERKAGSI